MAIKGGKFLDEMRELYSNDKLEILTLEKAKELIGKRIQTIFFGYAGQDRADDFIIGEIISSYDFAKRKPFHNEDFKNRAEYWDSMDNGTAKRAKEELIILRSDGSETYITKHPYNEAFSGNDADRFVSFRIVPK